MGYPEWVWIFLVWGGGSAHRTEHTLFNVLCCFSYAFCKASAPLGDITVMETGPTKQQSVCYTFLLRPPARHHAPIPEGYSRHLRMGSFALEMCISRDGRRVTRLEGEAKRALKSCICIYIYIYTCPYGYVLGGRVPNEPSGPGRAQMAENCYVTTGGLL